MTLDELRAKVKAASKPRRSTLADIEDESGNLIGVSFKRDGHLVEIIILGDNPRIAYVEDAEDTSDLWEFVRAPTDDDIDIFLKDPERFWGY